jgi:hypothetical protein
MKKILGILVVLMFIAGNVFALGNNSNSNTNGQNQGQNQDQVQLQGQLQGQNQTSFNKNKNLNINKNNNLNANKNTNINGNLNANKNDIDNSDSIVIEDEKQYIQPLQIVLPNGITGHNESEKDKGRRFISFKQQTAFGKVLTVETAKKMVASHSFGAKVIITPSVSKGDYPETSQLSVYPSLKSFEDDYGSLEGFILIGIATGQSKGKSNSAMLTAKSTIKGCKLGATYFVGFSEGVERIFKHRGFGGGGSVVDAFGTDTAAGSTSGLNLGSNRYEKFSYQKGYLLRAK